MSLSGLTHEVVTLVNDLHKVSLSGLTHEVVTLVNDLLPTNEGIIKI